MNSRLASGFSRNAVSISRSDRVTVRRAAFRVRFLYPEGHDYFATLREKLHWTATAERITGTGA